MVAITWKIKDSWVETKKTYPDEYTDYLFFNGWVKLSKLFPNIKNIYSIGGHFKGSHIYWHNFRRCDFGDVLHPWKCFFLRIDFGRRFIIITRPDPKCYRNVDIVEVIKWKNGLVWFVEKRIAGLWSNRITALWCVWSVGN